MSDLNFRIESSAKAYEILASNLYSDKVSAVIRELSCNAADAHVEAGIHEVPFEVDLPVGDNGVNYFRVRDFGSGLNAEQIEDVFTVFFSSTKTGSKAYTGAFGLGCKSPFAVADNFFVNSYINGKKYYYHCHRQNGIPAISFMKEETTNQKTGLEIIVPANNAKSSEWLEKATSIFEHFKTRPKINIRINFFNQNEVYKCGNNWENTENSGIWIVMNNVRYPVNLHKIDRNNFFVENFLSKRGVVYHVPPRSIEVTPSREGVSYTKETIDFLNNHIAKINKDFIENIQEQIQSCTTMLSAKFLYNKILSSFTEDYFGCAKFIHPSMFHWNGKKLSTSNYVNMSIAHKDTIEIGFFYKPHKYSANVKKSLYTNTEIPASSVFTLENTIFLINDTKASQETIKVWANRKFKKSNITSMTFLIVKEEYKNILKAYNGILESQLIKCSTENLQKITKSVYTNKKISLINIPLHVYSFKTNTIVDSNTKEEKDLISASADDRNNVFIIEYETMRWEHPEQFYIVEHKESSTWIKLSDLHHQIMSLVKNSKIVGDEMHLNCDKIILIKNLKKNKKFLTNYGKINKINFISFNTYFNDLFSKYISNNNSLLQYIAESYSLQYLLEINSNSVYLPPALEQKNKKNEDSDKDYALKLSYFYKFKELWEKYSHLDDDLKQVCEFLNKHSNIIDKNKSYKNINLSIAYLYHIFCQSDHEKMRQIIENNYSNALLIFSLLEKIWKKHSIMFADEITKTEKILEFSLQGKTV
jgi:hypothetical protein